MDRDRKVVRRHHRKEKYALQIAVETGSRFEARVASIDSAKALSTLD
jgi:hypothetical protein